MAKQAIKLRMRTLGELAWASSYALLGIVRLQDGEDMSRDQKLAFEEVFEKTKLLYEDTKLDSESFLNGNLTSEEVIAEPLVFKTSQITDEQHNLISQERLSKVIADLENISTFLNCNKGLEAEAEKLVNAQTYLTDLLALLNNRSEIDDIITRKELV